MLRSHGHATLPAMKVAYLVNQYPKISHVFIRREILAVESGGCQVERYSIRRSADRLIDPLDIEEDHRTRVVLDEGWWRLAGALGWAAATRLVSLARALFLALAMGRKSERGLLRHLVYLAEACVLTRWFLADKIEHVHAHFGTNSTTVAMLCHTLGGPTYSFTAHGPEEFDKALQLKLGEKIKQSTFVAAISSFGRSQLFRRCPFSEWSKVKVIRCGVDHTFLGPAPAPMPEKRRLVSIGRLCEQKGQILLIEAMAQLRREDRQVELLLIGDGAMRSPIEAAIRRNGLEDTVRILGWADSATIRNSLDESCAFVLPSFAEGLPVVIMEALARARPVLTTYVAGIPELVVHGRNGWLVPAGSVDALVDGLRQVLDTPMERLAEMGLCGREDVTRLHSIDNSARELISHFRDAVRE